MEQTLLKLKNLEDFIQRYGEDSFVSRTISKMLSYKIQKYEEEIKTLNKELKKFEQTHKKETSVFFREFNEGLLGDEMDFVEWSSLYRLHNRLLERKNTLEGKI